MAEPRITKALNKQFEEAARKLVETYNPYIKKSIKYFVDGEPRYLYFDISMTKKEIDDAYFETALKDLTNGYKERMVGYYDKWYRYCHADEGRAYDAGQKIATENPKCSDEFNIIECNR